MPSEWSAKWLVIYAAYTAAYLALREVETPWSNGEFSLWRPEAGLCFAFLWHLGPSRALPVASVHLAAETLSLRLTTLAADPWQIGLVVLEPIAFGAAIWTVLRFAESTRTPMDASSLPGNIAAVLAPIAAALAVLAIELARGRTLGADPAAATFTYGIGSLLGILLVTPAVLALVDRRANGIAADFERLTRNDWLELSVSLAAPFVLILSLLAGGFGLKLSPLLLSLIWIGFRFGSPVAAFATVVGAAPVLFITSRIDDIGVVLPAHLALVVIGIAGYFVGEISDNLRRLREAAERHQRDEVAQARASPAMSPVAIHEIAQPLSILMLETARLARSPDSSALADGLAVINQTAQRLCGILEKYRELAEESESDAERVVMRSLMGEALALALADPALADKAAMLRAQLSSVADRDLPDMSRSILGLIRSTMQNAGTVQAATDGRRNDEIYLEATHGTTSERNAAERRSDSADIEGEANLQPTLVPGVTKDG